jgi:hypothetical protein
MTLTDKGLDLQYTQHMILYSEYTSHCFFSTEDLVQLCKLTIMSAKLEFQ